MAPYILQGQSQQPGHRSPGRRQGGACVLTCLPTHVSVYVRVLLNAIVVAMLKGPSGAAWDLSFKKPVVLGISAGFLALATVLQGLLTLRANDRLHALQR